MEDEGAAEVAGFAGVDCFSGWRPRFSAVFAGSLGVEGFGVVGVFAAAGDLVGGFVLALVVEMGLGTVLLAVVFGASLVEVAGAAVVFVVFAGLSFTRAVPVPFAPRPLSAALPWPFAWPGFPSALLAVPGLP